MIYKLISFLCMVFFQVAIFALEPADIYKKLGQKVDLNLTFFNENGQKQKFQDLFAGNNVLILTLNYYRCTTMCTYQLMNLSNTLRELNWSIGDGFSVASISFDPNDTSKQAQNIRNSWLSILGTTEASWHFYTGHEDNIKKLTQSLNFYYEKDNEGNYSHAGALFFITKDGVFRKYLYGIVYDSRSLKNALIELSGESLGNVIDKIISKFYRYDSIRGKYFSKISLE